jgi:hypothetical protein
MIIEWDVTMRYSNSKKKWLFVLNKDHNTGSLVLPKGFEMDFVTSPRIFWAIVPQISKANRASANHDYRYRNTIGERDEADKIFLNELMEDGVPFVIADMMYLYVSLFGWIKWNKYKRINYEK